MLRPAVSERASAPAKTPEKRWLIVAVQAERATSSEADCLHDVVTRARFSGHQVADLVADGGYASEVSYAAFERLKATALIPPQPAAKHDAAVAARERMRTATGSSTMARAARDAAALGWSSFSCSPPRPRSTSKPPGRPPPRPRPADRRLKHPRSPDHQDDQPAHPRPDRNRQPHRD